MGEPISHWLMRTWL